MKELLQQYAGYTVWANKLIADCILQLSEEQIMQEINSSFSSIYKTVQHAWLAEEVWWKRHKLIDKIVLESESFDGPFKKMVRKHAEQSLKWKEWLDNCTKTQLEHVFAFIRNKEQHKMPTYQMIHHVFNHATYHRGQLVTMLRQLGITKIPSTDFSAYCKGK